MAATARMTGASGQVDLSVSTIRGVGALVLLGIWQGLALSGFFFRDVVPPLQKIAFGLAALFGNGAFYANLAVTGGELALALLIGGLAGLLVGLLLGGSQLMSAA